MKVLVLLLKHVLLCWGHAEMEDTLKELSVCIKWEADGLMTIMMEMLPGIQRH